MEGVETLGGDGYVLYIDCVDGSTDLYRSQNLSNCTLGEYGLLYVNYTLIMLLK